MTSQQREVDSTPPPGSPYPLEDAAVARSHAAQRYLLLGLILGLPVGVGLLLPQTLSLEMKGLH